MNVELIARPVVTEGSVTLLAEALRKAADQDGTDGVILAAYLRHLYNGPDPELAHEIGRRNLSALNTALRTRKLPPVCYDEHCFRFLT